VRRPRMVPHFAQCLLRALVDKMRDQVFAAGAPRSDEDPTVGRWVAPIPLPSTAAPLVGADARIRLTATPGADPERRPARCRRPPEPQPVTVVRGRGSNPAAR
jgi:hypothetical protein